MLSGGEDGAAGLNLLHRADGRVLNLGAKTSVSLQPGVRPLHVHVMKNADVTVEVVPMSDFMNVHCAWLPLQDMFSLYTPGGGGYGTEEETNGKPQAKRRRVNETFSERGSVFEYRMAQEGV